METCHIHNFWMEIKHDTGTSQYKSKSTAQANVANKFTILSESSDSATTTSDSNYAFTAVSDVNDLLAAALDQLGDNQLALYLISDALNVINK